MIFKQHTRASFHNQKPSAPKRTIGTASLGACGWCSAKKNILLPKNRRTELELSETLLDASDASNRNFHLYSE